MRSTRSRRPRRSSCRTRTESEIETPAGGDRHSEMSDGRAVKRLEAAGSGAFPLTRFSVVQATISDDAAIRIMAWDALIRSYWKPVYRYIRVKWQIDAEEAQDLTQEFFAGAMDRGFFSRFDPARARFRTYLRVCLHGFIANQYRAAGRKKRGGDYH